MKVLVTVGTTKFDTLIKYLSESHFPNEIEFTFQIADGDIQPENHPFFTFSDKIDLYYQESDVVICHAGAGTIYKLLEMKKKIIIVPNTERTDQHQLDIAAYMGKNNHAITVLDFGELSKALESIGKTELIPFEKHEFDKAEEMITFSLS